MLSNHGLCVCTACTLRVTIFSTGGINSGFKFYRVTSHHFYALLGEVEVCMAADMLTGTLLIGFDYHFDVCLLELLTT